MKKTVKLVALALVLILMLGTLVSCSSYGSIKKNFEKNGYVLQNEDNETQGQISTDDGVISYTIHTFKLESSGGIMGSITSGLSTAIVWEFGSDKDLQKALAENEDMQKVVDDAQESRYVNGNCILMTINPDAVKIFNGEDLEK